MVKYIFNVFDRNDHDKKVASVVTDVDHMLETLQTLSELGLVKGYIINDDEKE